jgi:hypothetical protein
MVAFLRFNDNADRFFEHEWWDADFDASHVEDL